MEGGTGKMKKYDSKNDTRKHIKRVAHYLAICKKELARKARLHDFDKIHDKTEKAMFDEYTPKLKHCTYVGLEEKIRKCRSLKKLVGT